MLPYIQEQLLQVFVTVKNALFEVLSPLHCCICENNMPPDHHPFIVCRRCEDLIPPGKPPEILLNSLLQHFTNDELSLSALYSYYSLYAPNENKLKFYHLIHAIKYQKKKELAKLCGIKMGHYIQSVLDGDYDGIIPVPLHNAKVRERGYNQSELLASGLAGVIHVPLLSKTLVRKEYTISQTTKSAAERVLNVKSVFQVTEPNSILSKRILLVDDVVTTGSTLNACATALLEAGAKRVDAITLTNV